MKILPDADRNARFPNATGDVTTALPDSRTNFVFDPSLELQKPSDVPSGLSTRHPPGCHSFVQIGHRAAFAGHLAVAS